MHMALGYLLDYLINSHNNPMNLVLLLLIPQTRKLRLEKLNNLPRIVRYAE